MVITITLTGIAQGLMNMQFRQSDKKILKNFSHSRFKPNIHFIEGEDRLIKVAEIIHNDTLPTIIFIHGAPGSSTDFIRYMADSVLQQKFNLISYDRPGYGYSDFGNSMVSIKDQAKVVKLLADRVKGKIYVVGHSYGGPICLRFAMDYPADCDGVLLLASANDPDHELMFKVAYLGKWFVTRLLTPTAMKVATDEKFGHVEELKKMLPYYDKITQRIIDIQGTKDSLVPFENLDFTENMLTHANFEKIVIENEDHFLPWTQYDLIRDSILKLTQ